MAKTAIYRMISLSFWTDPKVDDCFTPEDKYFYLYLLTNPHTTLCGCYEIGQKQLLRETGYSEETIIRLLDRMQNTHNVIRYDPETKEILLLNWSKHNWTKSADFVKGVIKSINQVKNPAFQEYLKQLLNESGEMAVPAIDNTLYTPSTDPRQTTVAVADTVPVSDSISVEIRYPQQKEFYDFCSEHKIQEEFAEELFERYCGNLWTMDDGKPIRNWRNVVLSAWRKEKAEQSKSGAKPEQRQPEKNYTTADLIEYPYGSGLYRPRQEVEGLGDG